MSATAIMLRSITVIFTLVLGTSGVFNFARGTILMSGRVLAHIFLVQRRWWTTAIVCAIATTERAGELLRYLIVVFLSSAVQEISVTATCRRWTLQRMLLLASAVRQPSVPLAFLRCR
jgi:branched-subunit amino acid ABC-type transport system permease component